MATNCAGAALQQHCPISAASLPRSGCPQFGAAAGAGVPKLTCKLAGATATVTVSLARKKAA